MSGQGGNQQQPVMYGVQQGPGMGPPQNVIHSLQQGPGMGPPQNVIHSPQQGPGMGPPQNVIHTPQLAQAQPQGNYPTSTGPNQYWGQQFGGNPFNPMTSADWAALENKYFPQPDTSTPPPPEIGTHEHYVEAGGSRMGGTGSAGYARYMQAMATLHGTREQGKYGGGQGGNYMFGSGEELSSPYGFRYKGKLYGPDQGAINWARNIAETGGDMTAAEAETMFGPSRNPGWVGSLSKSLMSWASEKFKDNPTLKDYFTRAFDITHPAYGGGRGALGAGGYGDFDAPGHRGPAQGYGYEGGDPAHDE